MFQITSDYQSENISDWCIFQIGFRLVSDWFQIGTKNFRLCLQISDCFRLLSDSFQTSLKIPKNFIFPPHISDYFRLAGASTEEENAAAAADAKEEEELLRTDLERWMEVADDKPERRVEAASEVTKIADRGMKEAAKKAEVKSAAAKAATEAADSVSSVGTSSAATSASTAACAFTRNTTSTSSIVGVAIRSGCTLIIIMLKVFDTRIRYIRVSAKRQARAEAMRVERKR